MGQARSVHAAIGLELTTVDFAIALGQRAPVPVGIVVHPRADARGSVAELLSCALMLRYVLVVNESREIAARLSRGSEVLPLPRRGPR